MSTIVTNITEFRSYISVSKAFQFELLKPFVAQAQREYLLPVLGKEMLNDLIEHYQDSAGSDQALDDVLAAGQEVLCLFTFYLAIPSLQLKMNETSLHAVSDEKYKSAYQWQVADYREGYLLAGYSAIESLYDVLTQHVGTLTAWRSSDGYAMANATLLRNAREFNAYYNIGQSNITFVDLKAAMARAQDLVLRNEVGAAFYDSLIAHLTGDDDSDSDTADADMLDVAVKKLRAALAPLAVGHATELLFRTVNGALLSTRYNPNTGADVKAFDDRLHNEFAINVRKNAMRVGYEMLSVARKWLDANADSFPLYRNGPGYRADGPDERTAEQRMHNETGMMMV